MGRGNVNGEYREKREREGERGREIEIYRKREIERGREGDILGSRGFAKKSVYII